MTMVMEVVKYPDPKLNRKSQKAQINHELEELVQNMMETVNSYTDPEAAGLSAIQVGVPLRVLIARDIVPADPAMKDVEPVVQDYIMVNPKIISASREEELDWEGCLSFPDLYGKVWRARKIKVKYQTLKGEEERLTASYFLARVIQHEMDHLDGITFNTKIEGKMYKESELDKNTKIVG